MYNLIVGFMSGQASSDRVVEYTDNAIRQYIAPAGLIEPARLRNLPTLLMPELQDSSTPQFARLGHVEDLTLTGGLYRFRFVPNQRFRRLTPPGSRSYPKPSRSTVGNSTAPIGR
jgi:hypothetical protein